MNRFLFLAIALALSCVLTLTPVSAVTAKTPLPPPSPMGSQQPDIVDRTAEKLAQLSLEQKVGQLFMPAADGDIKALIQTYHLGGLILFSRHTPTMDDTLRLTKIAQESAPEIPLFIAVDQEGGRVSRLSFGTQLPAARSFSVLDPDALWRTGRLVGDELRALGFNVNFAPVLDVDTSEENPVIGSRSFSSDPDLVARLGSAYIRGLHAAGVASAAKHFPGHGDTRTDSHLVLPTVNQPVSRLKDIEIRPFKEAINAEVDFLMIAHVHYPAIDPTPNLPASLSPKIISQLLRTDLAFNGIIITDALNMRAVTDGFDSAQAAVTAVKAGVDVLLMPADLPSAYQAIIDAIRSGEIPESRINQSVMRVLKLKQKLQANNLLQKALPNPEIVGSLLHRQKLENIFSTFESPYESKH